MDIDRSIKASSKTNNGDWSPFSCSSLGVLVLFLLAECQRRYGSIKTIQGTDVDVGCWCV